MTSTGRFTLPSEENFAEKTKELAELWGADAIRNSDGTHLDEAVLALGKKIYSAYFPTRADPLFDKRHDPGQGMAETDKNKFDRLNRQRKPVEDKAQTGEPAA